MSRIKICGLFRREDIDFANAVRPDYIGFVFADSSRKISYEQARLFKTLLDKNINAVGVFVNHDIDFIKKLCYNGIIDKIQLHGDEGEDYIDSLRCLNIPVIKAFRIEKELDNELLYRINKSKADFILFDKLSDKARGGLGESFDWSVLKKVERDYFLAGGINLQNIDEALRLNPYALDLSSSVEENGVKSLTLMKKVVNKVRDFNFLG